MKEGKDFSPNNRFWLVALLLAGIVIAAQYFIHRRKRAQNEKSLNIGSQPVDQAVSTRITGLTKEEAAKRQGDFDLEAETRKEDRQFLRTAIRQSLITTYNIDLFGIALILYLLGNPLGAIGTMLIVALNLILNVIQQMYTRRKLNLILKDLRPQAVVIRDGELASIEPALIVDGDCLVVRPGDEFLVDGEIVGAGEVQVEQIDISGEGVKFTKSRGDLVSAGSFCLEGHTIYRSSESGIDRYRTGPASRLQLLLGELTPLQRFMELVFRILFGVVLFIGALLIADSLLTGTTLVNTASWDAFSILFGIAPTSLFFILIITYAIGALRISDRGALVYEAQSIETLADASVLCISEESLVSGLEVDLELITPPEGVEPLSENLVRNILGDFVHSLPNLSLVDQMLSDALPGQAYTSIEMMPYLDNFGWEAASFDELDLRGTLVMGNAEVLTDNLMRTNIDFFENSEARLSKAWHRITKRLRQQPEGQVEGQPDTKITHTESGLHGFGSQANQVKKSGLQKLANRLDQLLSPMEDQAFYKFGAQEHPPDIHLIFAYLPDPVPIFDRRGEPLLPENLIAVSHVGISAVLRSEGGQTIRSLVEAGLKVKMLSADAAERAEKTALDLGLQADQIEMVSGAELDELFGSTLTNTIQNRNVLVDMAPSQKAAVVDALQLDGENVVMLGNSVQDMPAMKMANLKIALRNSARAAMKLTDIVLLKDSLEALPRVITTGQRLVNGILDIFKLYLSQTIAQMLLVLSILVVGYTQFPYHPTQAGIVSLFTVALPGIFLSVWAEAGRVTGKNIRQQLVRFIIPAAITLALLSWGVYLTFFALYQSVEYAQLAVTYALLIAGWMRVLFVQPPAPFWAGGAPLRGDRRVVFVVLGSVLLFLLIISMPFFQEIMRVTWLRSVGDYLIVILASVIWGLLTLAIWRTRWFAKMIDKI